MMLYSASRTQKLVSLSPAEAELYACSSGVSDSILLSRLISWMTGDTVTTCLYTDSSRAKGMIHRQGVGRVRHLSCRVLWLQDFVGSGQIKVSTKAGSLNPVDIGTKCMPCNRLMRTLGMYNTTAKELEGTEDSINFYNKKQHVLAILSVLGLGELKGCDVDESAVPPAGIIFFTVLLGLALILSRKSSTMPQQQVQKDEPEPEMLSNDHIDHHANAASSSDAPVSISTATATPEPTVEGLVMWLIGRCERRRDTAESHDRRRLYEERVTILYGLHSALTSEVESWRIAARRSLATLSDISDDENSPNHSAINAPGSLGNAQRTVNFLQTLQLGASSSSGFSTSIDTMYNAIGRGNPPVEEPDESLDEAMETRSQMERRYMDAQQCEVSDSDLWVLLKYGEGSESEESTEGLRFKF